MTCEQFQAVLTDWGVPFETSQTEDGVVVVEIGGLDKPRWPAKVLGYMGFYVDFVFDADGNFVSVGIWE